MFTVICLFTTPHGESGDHVTFESERGARAWINARADGTGVYTLLDADGDVIVESSFPVMMVA